MTSSLSRSVSTDAGHRLNRLIRWTGRSAAATAGLRQAAGPARSRSELGPRPHGIWVTLPYMTATQQGQRPGPSAGTDQADRWRAQAAPALSALVIACDPTILSGALLGAAGAS